MSKLTGKYLDPSSFKTNTSTGDGATTVFNLTDNPISINALWVYVDGLFQEPTTDYSLSGNQVTFTTAPANAQQLNFRYIKGS